MARRLVDDLAMDTARRTGWLPFQRRQNVTSPFLPGDPLPPAARQGIFVEAIDCRDADIDVAAWTDLSTRATANLFLHPAFVLTAIRHQPAVDRPVLVLAWENADRRRLTGLCPIHVPASPAARIATVWSYPDAPLGEPLLDRESAGDAMEAMLEFIGATWPRMFAVSMTGIRPDAAVRRLPAGHRVEPVDNSMREFVSFQASHHSAGDETLRTDQFDDCWITVSEEHDEVRADLENFLTLDAAQAGAGRPALIDEAGFAAFARSITRQLSRTGQCSIHRLMRGSEPLAAAILLHEQDRTWLWKFTAARDPGHAKDIRRFVARLVHVQARLGRDTILCMPLPVDGTVGLLPTRLTCSDVIVTLPGRSSSDVANALRRERRRRFARAIGRHLVAIASGAQRP